MGYLNYPCRRDEMTDLRVPPFFFTRYSATQLTPDVLLRRATVEAALFNPNNPH